MREDKDFKIVTKILGGRKVKVSVSKKTIGKEEFEKRITEILKKAIEREKAG
ncbi:MAG: hypothetical protein QW633_03625 [Candidatus Aenigmatarchaeota archaeon]